jgi:hypothetical protein
MIREGLRASVDALDDEVAVATEAAGDDAVLLSFAASFSSAVSAWRVRAEELEEVFAAMSQQLTVAANHLPGNVERLWVAATRWADKQVASEPTDGRIRLHGTPDEHFLRLLTRTMWDQGVSTEDIIPLAQRDLGPSAVLFIEGYRRLHAKEEPRELGEG